MTESEIRKLVQAKVMETNEMKNFTESTTKLTNFLKQYVPQEKGEELGELISNYAEVSATLGQRGMIIAEELAEGENE